GFSVQGPGKSESAAPRADMRLSVLRSPLYAFHEHGPLPWGPGKLDRYTDQGRQTLAIGLVPHAGRWQDTDLVRRAYELNNPPIVVLEPGHAGELPAVQGFVEVEPENVIVSVVKRAEDSPALILRCYETAGRKTTARIQIPHLDWSWEGPIGQCEIKTLKVSGAGPSAVTRETDLLERDKYG
ncbi:MAG: glycosyl hydrolase-related protein, partial [Anaerolineae bacterium]